MRNLLLLCLMISFISCEKNETNDCFPTTYVNEIININLPQYIGLQTPSNSIYVSNIGIKGIIIQNVGSGYPSSYKAFDGACPISDCSSPLIFDGSTKLTCPCDKSEYSIIDGHPLNNGSCSAKEYRVRASSNLLNITEF